MLKALIFSRNDKTEVTVHRNISPNGFIVNRLKFNYIHFKDAEELINWLYLNI